MPILHVYNIPDDLFLQIQALAKIQGRSFNTQVISLLTHALRLEKEKDRKTQVKALASIRQRRFSAPKNSPSSLTLLREDLNR